MGNCTFMLYMGIMATGNLIKLPRMFTIEIIQKHAKFNAFIAKHVRIRRAPCLNFVNDVCNHIIPILFLQGNYLQIYPYLIADGARILQIIVPWTITQECKLIFEPDFQIKGGYAMPLLMQQSQ